MGGDRGKMKLSDEVGKINLETAEKKRVGKQRDLRFLHSRDRAAEEPHVGKSSSRITHLVLVQPWQLD